MINFDAMIHDFFEVHKSMRWIDLNFGLEYYYAEEQLYIIHKRGTGEFCLVKAKSPKEAVENALFCVSVDKE